MPNETVDDAENLDLTALGLLTVLIRHMDGWEITLAEIGAKYGYGRDAMANAMGLLQVARYVVKVRMMSVGKNEWSTEVYVYDTPASDAEIEALLMEIDRSPEVRSGTASVIKPSPGAFEHAAKRREKVRVKRRQGPSVAIPRVPENPHSGATCGNAVSVQVGPDCGFPRQSVDPAVSKKTVGEKTKEKTSAPLARSALDAGGKTSGSSARASGGSAASSKTKPAGVKTTAEQRAVVRAVLAGFPAELDLPAKTPRNLAQAILGALAPGQPGERTVEQLHARVAARWLAHGHADRHAAGALERPVGVAVALVRPLAAGDRYGCPGPRCEDGVSVDTGEACSACAERIADRRAERRSAEGTRLPRSTSMPNALPSPRAVIHDTAGTTAECPGRDGMCGRPAPRSPSGLCVRCERDAADGELAAVSGGTMTP